MASTFYNIVFQVGTTPLPSFPYLVRGALSFWVNAERTMANLSFFTFFTCQCVVASKLSGEHSDLLLVGKSLAFFEAQLITTRLQSRHLY